MKSAIMVLHTLAAVVPLIALSAAQLMSPQPVDLVGTWSSKSNKTLTGPGFYDPVGEKLIEPSHTGISYSFTADGFYESAFYRAISNPTQPNCPGGIMQWQHGSWTQLVNGSLILEPIAIDGRSLQSEPCKYKNAVYMRYNQSEMMQRYSVYNDPYHNIPRLDLYQFNGAPQQPLYLAYSPPEMLPTTTLHPPAATATSGSSKLKKRGLSPETPLRAWEAPSDGNFVQQIDAERLWWVGLALTGIGGLLYLGPRRLGLNGFGASARDQARV